MPTPPELADVLGYLGPNTSWSDEEVAAALLAETAAQAAVVRFPADPPPPAEAQAYPADLAEALFRRVAHNLAVRALPLGVQATVTDGAALSTYVGGTDAEVKRLEAPYRKRVVA